jgi:hypothetical protein
VPPSSGSMVAPVRKGPSPAIRSPPRGSITGSSHISSPSLGVFPVFDAAAVLSPVSSPMQLPSVSSPSSSSLPVASVVTESVVPPFPEVMVHVRGFPPVGRLIFSWRSRRSLVVNNTASDIVLWSVEDRTNLASVDQSAGFVLPFFVPNLEVTRVNAGQRYGFTFLHAGSSVCLTLEPLS